MFSFPNEAFGSGGCCCEILTSCLYIFRVREWRRHWEDATSTNNGEISLMISENQFIVNPCLLIFPILPARI